MAAAFRTAGVIGWPVSHSRSPLLHGHWLREYGIAGAYIPLPVRPGELALALRGLRALGFAGCNVTVPHKEEAARLVDTLDPAAARLGAVNLITIGADGSLHGASNDGAAFLAALAEARPGWCAEAGPAIVLGAGGAARAIVAALLDAGASQIRVLNRTRARADALARGVGGALAGTLGGGLGGALGGAITVDDWDRRHAALADAALLVNTTTQGMAGQPPLDLDLTALPVTALVSDIVYVPAETALLREARARGNFVAPGLPMLLHQARPAFAAWFGVMPEVTQALRDAVQASLA